MTLIDLEVTAPEFTVKFVALKEATPISVLVAVIP